MADALVVDAAVRAVEQHGPTKTAMVATKIDVSV